jgi:hypothetical protein
MWLNYSGNSPKWPRFPKPKLWHKNRRWGRRLPWAHRYSTAPGFLFSSFSMGERLSTSHVRPFVCMFVRILPIPFSFFYKHHPFHSEISPIRHETAAERQQPRGAIVVLAAPVLSTWVDLAMAATVAVENLNPKVRGALSVPFSFLYVSCICFLLGISLRWSVSWGGLASTCFFFFFISEVVLLASSDYPLYYLFSSIQYIILYFISSLFFCCLEEF